MTFSEIMLAFGVLQVVAAILLLAYLLPRYGIGVFDQIGKVIRRIFG